MTGIEYYDYWSPYASLEENVKRAALCAATHPLANDSSIQLLDSLSSLSNLNMDWDDEAGEHFRSCLSNIVSSFSNIQSAASSYSSVENAYQQLAQEFQTLKKTDALWKANQNPPSEHDSKYNETRTTIDSAGVTTQENVFLKDKYRADYDAWFLKVKEYKEICEHANTNISDLLKSLEGVNGIDIADGVSIAMPNINLSGNFLTYDTGFASYQDIYREYILVNPSVFEQADIDYWNWTSHNELGFSAFYDYLVRQYGEEGAAQKMSDGLELKGKNDTVEYLMNRYNMTKFDVFKVINSFERSKGNCSYDGVAGMIFGEYEGKSIQFEQDFGFPMYKILDSRKFAIRDKGAISAGGDIKFEYDDDTLLLDLYIYSNIEGNAADTGERLTESALFYWEGDNLKVNPTYDKGSYIDDSARVYLGTENDVRDNDVLNGYLKNHNNSNLNCLRTRKTYKNLTNNEDVPNIKQMLEQAKTEGKSVILHMRETTKLGSRDTEYQSKTDYKWETVVTYDRGYEGNKTGDNVPQILGNHDVYVTGYDDNCIYFSSLGNIYSLSWDNFNSFVRLDFDVCQINGIGE